MTPSNINSFNDTILFRIVHCKRISKVLDSHFYYKIRKNTLTIRMIRGWDINYLDIVRLLLKDREFIDYYLSDRYSLYTYRYSDIFMKPAVDKFVEGASTTCILVEGGVEKAILFKLNSYHQFQFVDGGVKLNLKYFLLFLRRYFYNYVDMHECTPGVSYPTYYATFNATNFHKDKFSANQLRTHIMKSKELVSSDIVTSAFMERCIMSVFSPSDENYTMNGETEIRLFPYRTMKELMSARAQGSFDKLYDKYKKYITTYTIVYFKPRYDDFDISKEECFNIIDNYSKDQFKLTGVIKEFGEVFNYSHFI